MPAETAKAPAAILQNLVLPLIFATGIFSGIVLESRVFSSASADAKQALASTALQPGAIGPGATRADSGSPVTAPLPTPKPDTPLLAVDKLSFDFGERSESDSFENSFVLSNSGTRPVEIRQIGVDCGWISAHLKDNIISPGASTNLTIYGRLQGRKGPQKQNLLLTSNAPTPQTSITITGSVIAAQPVPEVNGETSQK